MYGMTHGAQVSMNWSSYSCLMLSSTIAGLRGHDGEQRLQLAAGRGVAGAVDGGQQRVELLGVEAHDQSPIWPWVAGSSWSSSAPAAARGPLAHSSAGARARQRRPLRPSAWSWTAVTPATSAG